MHLGNFRSRDLNNELRSRPVDWHCWLVVCEHTVFVPRRRPSEEVCVLVDLSSRFRSENEEIRPEATTNEGNENLLCVVVLAVPKAPHCQPTRRDEEET